MLSTCASGIAELIMLSWSFPVTDVPSAHEHAHTVDCEKLEAVDCEQ
jgi:hypothetical protein